MSKAVILMATYNGAQYIREQLDSIIHQDYTDWDLYISDNGSSDGTLEILTEYQMIEPRIKQIYNNYEMQGAFCNYYYLIRKLKDEPPYHYYFYCDQDDVWKKNKLSLSVKCMDRMEKKYGTIPLLCYSDAELIDENGESLGKRLSDNNNIKLKNPYNLFFAHRFIWGTTMVHNYSLFKLVDIPSDISEDISHDNYFGKYAATYGKIGYINSPILYYRRHGDNVSSLHQKYNLFGAIKRVVFHFPKVLNNFAKTFWATSFFIKHAPVENELIVDLKACLDCNGISAIRFIRKYKVNYNGSIYNKLAFLIILISGMYKKTRWFIED